MKRWPYVLAFTLTAGLAVASFVRGSIRSDSNTDDDTAVLSEGAHHPSDLCPGRALHARLERSAPATAER